MVNPSAHLKPVCSRDLAPPAGPPTPAQLVAGRPAYSCLMKFCQPVSLPSCLSENFASLFIYPPACLPFCLSASSASLLTCQLALLSSLHPLCLLIINQIATLFFVSTLGFFQTPPFPNSGGCTVATPLHISVP